jgi:hypothetical protein
MLVEYSVTMKMLSLTAFMNRYAADSSAKYAVKWTLEYAGLADLMILHVVENDLKAERKSAKGALIAAHSVEEKKMTDDVMPMVTL